MQLDAVLSKRIGALKNEVSVKVDIFLLLLLEYVEYVIT